MFIPPDADLTVERLGDKIVTAIASAVAGARFDLADLRKDKPGIVADFDERTMANVIHNRVWVRITRELGDVDTVRLHDSEPHHEIVLDWCRLTVKRHSKVGVLRGYPTQSALDFYGQVADEDLLGEQEIHLATGYVWESDMRTIGEPVLSLPSGLKREPYWMVTLPSADDIRIDTVEPRTSPDDGPARPTVDAPNYDRDQHEGTDDE